MGSEISREYVSLRDICKQISELATASYLQSDAFIQLRKYSDQIDELYQILSTKDESGNTLLHGQNLLTEDLARLFTEQNKKVYLIAILKEQNNAGKTVLHTLDLWSHNLVQQLANYETHVHTLCELLSMKDADGNTPLHRSFDLTHYIIKLFLSWKSEHSQLKLINLLKIQDSTGKTVLHQFESRMNKTTKLFRQFHDLQEVGKLLKVRTYYLGNTVFHWNKTLTIEMVKLFRKRGKTLEILRILMVQNNFGDTVLQSFNSQSRWNINLFLELQEKQFALEISDVYSVKNFEGSTVLHQNEDIALTVLNAFESWKMFKYHQDLMSLTDTNGSTVADTIVEIRRPRSAAWYSAQNRHTKCYTLYHPHVLILYMTEDRPGAELEVDSIVSVFRVLPCQLIVEKDKSRDHIINLVKKTAYNSTALITVIMSHGTSGMFQDVHKTFYSLSEIENAMSTTQMAQRPKLLIAQCCQRGGTSSKQDPGRNVKATPSTADDHVYAPKNDDFCAILSCVSGEFSTRNVFIPKLAKQIRSCSKTDTIEDCFKAVKREMKNENFQQTPIMHSTLHKKLCLRNMFEK